MSWSEGRTAAPSGAPDARQAALDRVDGLLRAFAQDQLLQDDLKNLDVRRAIEHWTGRNRLSQEDADELMEDNYRIQSVCTKMAELQSCCKLAGIVLPLPQLLSGEGLYSSRDPAAVVGDSSSGGDGSSSGAGGGSGGGSSSSGASSGDSARRRRPPASGQASPGEHGVGVGVSPAGTSRGDPRSQDGASPLMEAAKGGEGEEGESTWRQMFIDEAWRVGGVCLSALVFTSALKYFRGDDPLGLWRDSGGGGAGAAGQDEL